MYSLGLRDGTRQQVQGAGGGGAHWDGRAGIPCYHIAFPVGEVVVPIGRAWLSDSHCSTHGSYSGVNCRRKEAVTPFTLLVWGATPTSLYGNTAEGELGWGQDAAGV